VPDEVVSFKLPKADAELVTELAKAWCKTEEYVLRAAVKIGLGAVTRAAQEKHDAV
jgi:predicted transcriptional regulator